MTVRIRVGSSEGPPQLLRVYLICPRAPSPGEPAAARSEGARIDGHQSASNVRTGAEASKDRSHPCCVAPMAFPPCDRCDQARQFTGDRSCEAIDCAGIKRRRARLRCTWDLAAKSAHPLFPVSDALPKGLRNRSEAGAFPPNIVVSLIAAASTHAPVEGRGHRRPQRASSSRLSGHPAGIDNTLMQS
jgi:hypothetical protein